MATIVAVPHRDGAPLCFGLSPPIWNPFSLIISKGEGRYVVQATEGPDLLPELERQR